MRIGYARVSTTEQNLDLQRDALKRAGCDKIIEDTVSGGKVHRSGLERVRESLRPGDVLVVWRLDRLGRSLKHLIELMAEPEAERIGFQSVTESIDSTTPVGILVFHVGIERSIPERNALLFNRFVCPRPLSDGTAITTPPRTSFVELNGYG